jgi:hypothetical protein
MVIPLLVLALGHSIFEEVLWAVTKPQSDKESMRELIDLIN